MEISSAAVTGGAGAGGGTNSSGAAGLTPSQRGELELAKARAERAAAGRHKAAGGGGNGGGGSGGGGGSNKRQRGGGGSRRSRPRDDDSSDEDDEDGGGGPGSGGAGDASDGELERLSKLSPEELAARLAAGGGGNDKDARRLKRLLRNRVSAQQARERKKQYVTSLEDQIREQQSHIGLLEKRIEVVESQNDALRNIIRTMRGFADAPAPPAAAAAGPGEAAAQQPPQDGAARAAAGRAPPQTAAAPAAPAAPAPAPAAVAANAAAGPADAAAREQAPQRQPPQSRHSRAQIVPAAPGPGPAAGGVPAPVGAHAAMVPQAPHPVAQQAQHLQPHFAPPGACAPAPGGGAMVPHAQPHPQHPMLQPHGSGAVPHLQMQQMQPYSSAVLQPQLSHTHSQQHMMVLQPGPAAASIMRPGLQPHPPQQLRGGAMVAPAPHAAAAMGGPPMVQRAGGHVSGGPAAMMEDLSDVGVVPPAVEALDYCVPDFC
ncbi:hypothetical protein HXX76_013030 [Chlamydomonas incerta]|uniref:BZIP domain-containing protein n=1 Tax=Chlamydomonas incerta TaxID=51695 RepID=A0A835SMM2_CHLIN|nr:hypothetical protein HXX76_013030 [Chlamydomonas incerta]|eukprot:KAG2426273.1 hypothetical protein HXX76_013030 [Chlamydomonas incerta]